VFESTIGDGLGAIKMLRQCAECGVRRRLAITQRIAEAVLVEGLVPTLGRNAESHDLACLCVTRGDSGGTMIKGIFGNI